MKNKYRNKFFINNYNNIYIYNNNCKILLQIIKYYTYIYKNYHCL